MRPTLVLGTRLRASLVGIEGRKLGLLFRNWGAWLDDTNTLTFVVPVCPLYAPGPIQESTLLPNPTTIEASRVGGKWLAIKRIVQVLGEQNWLELVRIGICIPFADLGVIGRTTDGLQATLDRHAEVYEKAARELDRESAGRYQISFCRYSEIGVQCDLVIRPDEECPADIVDLPLKERIVERVKRKLRVTELAYGSGELIPRLAREFGESLTVGLLYSYRAPDAQLQKLGNVMVNIERPRSVPSETGRRMEREPSFLFNVARLDLHSWQAQAPTIEVSCDL